jgi:hypothetical protein
MAITDLYPWQVVPVDKGYTTSSTSGAHVKNHERDVEMFRRILEALGNEPVDVHSEENALYGRSVVRVYFRHSGVYSQVDLGHASYNGYGGAMLEDLARDCIRQKNEYQDIKLQKAYIGRDIMPQSAPSPPKAKKKAKTPTQPKENSYENPLRVKLQKEVNAWLC